MELTSAQWLNTAFSSFDGALLGFMHTLAKGAGGLLTPLMKLITLLGEKGIIMFLLAFALMCLPRTRKLGLCIFGAVCCGALITNVILKDAIARARPFESMELYRQYWAFIGAPVEDGFSFPSGHVTAAAAGMCAICLMQGKKFILPSALVVFFMCVSRNYLIAHYPSDVLAAAIVGTVSAFIAYWISRLIFRILEEHSDIPLFAFLLEFEITLPTFHRYKGKHEA